MLDPTTALTAAIDNATKVANTPFFTTVIDKITGFKISLWAAEGEVRKKMVHDEYEKAKENGIMGVQYISDLRSVTNLIDTAVKSAKYIEPNKINEIKIDNDFFWNAIEHSKTISNEEMQELIAKIIAGEYNNPGSYTMSTLHVIKMLGKSELELFEKTCGLIINESHVPYDLFTGTDDVIEVMKEVNLDFGKLQILQSLGLFLPNEMKNSLPNPEKKELHIQYFDKLIVFEPENDNYQKIQFPNFYALSGVGKEILKHLKPKFYKTYYDWLMEYYKIPNYKIKKYSFSSQDIHP